MINKKPNQANSVNQKQKEKQDEKNKSPLGNKQGATRKIYPEL